MLGESVELAIFYNLGLSRVALQLLPEKVNRKSGNGVHSATCMCDAHRSPIFDLLSFVKVGVGPIVRLVQVSQMTETVTKPAAGAATDPQKIHQKRNGC